MFKFKYFSLLAVLSLSLQQCVMDNNAYKHIAPGIWRGELELGGANLPFNFTYEEVDGKPVITIMNGEERIRTEDIIFTKGRGQDTIRINFPHYDSYIYAACGDEDMKGEWVVTTRKDYHVAFKAKRNENWRFKTRADRTPKADLTGRWRTTFYEDSTSYPAVGEFKQNGKKLEGTFLTSTGDYRYLEGNVDGDTLYLSCFDGSHAFCFRASIENKDQIIKGGFFAGMHGRETWEAVRDESASLPDAYSLTKVTTAGPVSFTFPNDAGKMISLNDPAYAGKVKLVQIMGSWCPNCADEAVALKSIYEKYHGKGLEIIGLAFEKHKEAPKAAAVISRFKGRFGLNWEILHAGHPKDDGVKSIPVLDKIMSYPTLMVLDKQNKVVKIHTGFSGPATSGYKKFIDETDALVSQLLN